jgi:hypothetical protein
LSGSIAKDKKSVSHASDDGEINLEEMLNDICLQITAIYKKTLNPHMDMHSVSKPLDLLT